MPSDRSMDGSLLSFPTTLNQIIVLFLSVHSFDTPRKDHSDLLSLILSHQQQLSTRRKASTTAQKKKLWAAKISNRFF